MCYFPSPDGHSQKDNCNTLLNKVFIIWKTGHFISPSTFLLQIPPLHHTLSHKNGPLALKYNKAIVYSVYRDILSMVTLKSDHPTWKPTMFTGGMGWETYVPGRSVPVSQASGKTRVYGSI